MNGLLKRTPVLEVLSETQGKTMWAVEKELREQGHMPDRNDTLMGTAQLSNVIYMLERRGAIRRAETPRTAERGIQVEFFRTAEGTRYLAELRGELELTPPPLKDLYREDSSADEPPGEDPPPWDPLHPRLPLTFPGR